MLGVVHGFFRVHFHSILTSDPNLIIYTHVDYTSPLLIQSNINQQTDSVRILMFDFQQQKHTTYCYLTMVAV